MVVRFGPADVGRRVTLRRRLLDAEPGGPSLGDVVGVLEHWSDGSLSVRRRTGEVVDVPLLAVVAGRVVAPEVSADDLARRADDTWRPRESDSHGEWRLRAHGGVTHRPNSALAVGDPGMPVAATLPAVREWYVARGLPPNVMTPLPSPVADTYRALGWREESRTLVMAAALADLTVRADGAPVALTDQPPVDWTAVLPRLRDPEVAPLYRELLTGTAGAVFATARGTDGSALAVARGAISGGWMNLTNVEVVPEARRRGLATAVIGTLGQWAVAAGATHAFLQLWPDNEAGVRLYTALGFVPHHEYAYFVDPLADPQAVPRA